jgi:hypothetical protein
MAEAFPTEVWEMSWICASIKDLKALSSSCRLFRDICQPLLFERLKCLGPLLDEISPTKPEKTVEQMKRSRDRLHSIASNAKISSMVQSWTFDLPTESKNISTDIDAMIRDYPATEQIIHLSRAICSTFSSTIGVYTNLSELTIVCFQFTPNFCEALASLPKLTMMHIMFCGVDCPVSFGGIALEHFVCGYEGWGSQDALGYLVSGSKLEQLELLYPATAGPCLKVFAVSGPLPHLVALNLHLDGGSKDVFYQFLDCCPQLKCIRLEAPPTFAGVTLPETSIPTLRAFQGPLEIAGVFAGGRPVRSFDIQRRFGANEPADPTVVQQTLLQISTSSATLEYLTLPLLFLDSVPIRFIAENLPGLKHLVFFLRDTGTRALASQDPQSDEESEGDWETVGGSSQAGSADEVIDVDEDDEHHSTGWMPLSELLNLSAQDGPLNELLSISNLEEAMLEAMFKAQDGNGHYSDDCASQCSYASDSESIDWSEGNSKTYEDQTPNSFEVSEDILT